MNKAKTRKNLISILSAILGVVFALITGFTYAVRSATYDYGVNPNSTTAYLGNQQYHIINDTIENPIAFGEGSHNCEIALQYAFDYAFDVRFKYSMTWTGDIPATNVSLNFANRDNIIYDETYIYFVDSVAAGNGKIPFITGVEIVNNLDEDYFGKTLTINIDEVKIYKSQTSYSLEDHVLTKDNNVKTKLSAQAWIYAKNRNTSSTAYAMMYNFRKNFESGVPYPGLESAYKKPVNDATSLVSGPAWAGGNRSFAGVGMYVIAGTTPLKLEVEVAGIWREKIVEDDSTTIQDANPSFISENSIRFNYSSKWEHSSWDSSNLWETRKLSVVIPANKACYIDILSSVEVTSASKIGTNLFDRYRAVINKITVNPSLASKTAFVYTESSTSGLQLDSIATNANLTVTKQYAQETVSVVNTSLYSNGLYTAQVGSSATTQSFNTSISLINNTATTQTVTLNYKLWYHVNNTQRDLTGSITDGGAEYRADKFVSDGVLSKLQAFNQEINYTYEEDSTRLTSATISKMTIAPYSSVSLMESYSVGSSLQSDISQLFDPMVKDSGGNYYQEDGVTDNYDAWTYLVVTPTPAATAETATNLTIETTQNGNQVSLSVKNNTTTTISGLTISNVEANELVVSTTYSSVDTKPNDWTASYWKYYEYDATNGYTKLTSDPITAQNPFVPNTYFEKPQTYSPLTITATDKFTKSEKTFTSKSGFSLQPGESIVFGTATTSSTKNVVVTGQAVTTSTTAANTLMLINNGKSSAYIINNTDKTATPQSYYVRFTGELVTSVANIEEADVTSGSTTTTHNYYIGIVRPGQIISIPMSSAGTLDSIVASGNYSASTLSSWNSTIVAQMTAIFAV